MKMELERREDVPAGTDKIGLGAAGREGVDWRVASPPEAPGKKRDRTAKVEKGRQRVTCEKLLQRWLPLATADEIALQKEGRNGLVIDDNPFEAGLKAGAFVLKILERLAKLEGLDSENESGKEGAEIIDPLELARRVQVVSPILAARLGGEKNLK